MRTEPVRPVDTLSLYWLTAGLILAILPHGLRMPQWILPLTLALILWRLGGDLKGWQLPDGKYRSLRLLQIFIMVGSGLGVYISFHTLAGREAGSALLVLLTGFKILETRRERDFYIAIFLGFFVIVTNFFVSETIATAIYMLLTLLIMLTALITFNDHNHSLNIVTRLKTAGGLLLQAVPVMLVLFLLFPRINGPLWGMPQDAQARMMGVDDVMEPGSISRLVRSNEVAFRVEFDGAPPDNSKLYWRGPVLWYNDGHKWSRKKIIGIEPPPLETAGAPVNYTITLEPTSQRWLYALEMAKQAPGNAYIANDYQLLTREPVNKRIRYELSTYPEYALGRNNAYGTQRALQLPGNFHSRTIALGKSWANEETDAVSIVNRALRMFNEQNFYYTLTPPLLTGDNVDDFLFDTRQGFCEHYAGAFVVLMRAAGIPARIVAGYQGISFNPVGNYYIVYQRDAHAWAEVWLDGRGWVRIDPTSAVAPERVQQGIAGALPEAIFGVPAVFGQIKLSRDMWQNLRNTWDAVNNQWNQWVISYGPDRQTLLLKKFGVKEINLQLLAIVLVIIAAIMFTFITIFLLRQYQPGRDPTRQLYDRFCQKLSRIGIHRMPHEGPLDFSARVAQKQKLLANMVDEITRLYVSARYGSQVTKLTALKKKINAFNPGKILKIKAAQS
jgi:transglutaminase-like putative cysteine protease